MKKGKLFIINTVGSSTNYLFGNIEKADDTLLLRVMMKLLDDKYKADALLKRNK